MQSNAALISIDQISLRNFIKKCASAELAQEMLLHDLKPNLQRQGAVLELFDFWDPIHRCLTSGKLNFNDGELPLKSCFIGGKTLYSEPYFSAWYTPYELTSAVAKGLSEFSREKIWERYSNILDIDPTAAIRNPRGPEVEFGEEDFNKLWCFFLQLAPFFSRSGNLGHDVMFTLRGDC